MVYLVVKLSEKILLQRLNEYLDQNGGLSPNQFGFRKGCSTDYTINKVLEKSRILLIAKGPKGKASRDWPNHGISQWQELCVLVVLDVKYAFNSVPLEHVHESLLHRGFLVIHKTFQGHTLRDVDLH